MMTPMPTRHMSRAARHAQMAPIVAAWRQSGQPKAVFARVVGVSLRVFHYWCGVCAGGAPAPRSAGRRPKCLQIGGGILRIDVHDAYYRVTAQRLRQQMCDCHPDRRPWTKLGLVHHGQIRPIHRVDRPHAIAPFLVARRRLDTWLAQERRWYATYGLRPPGKAIGGPPPPSPRRRGHVLEESPLTMSFVKKRERNPMMRVLVIVVAVLVAASSSVFAQTAPCDAASFPTAGTVVAGQPMTITVCYLDTLPAPASWALYDGAVRMPITMTADTVTSATNGRQYSATLTAPSAVGSVHTYTIAAINASGVEGGASLPFVSTVNPVPLPAPGVPTHLRLR